MEQSDLLKFLEVSVMQDSNTRQESFMQTLLIRGTPEWKGEETVNART